MKDAKCEECGRRLTWEQPGVTLCEACEDYLEGRGEDRPYRDPFRPAGPWPDDNDWDR